MRKNMHILGYRDYAYFVNMHIPHRRDYAYFENAYRRKDMTMTMNIQNSRMDSHTICIFVYRLSTSELDVSSNKIYKCLMSVDGICLPCMSRRKTATTLLIIYSVPFPEEMRVRPEGCSWIHGFCCDCTSISRRGVRTFMLSL